jgi:hypothetical protein
MITLPAIKAEHARITEMIAAFEAQANEPRTVYFPSARIDLQPGEHYAGVIVGKDGAAPYHLILLPGEAESVNWADAKAFAQETGGHLPTRREQSLLYANLKEQFQEKAYWSGEQHAANSDFAWYQRFSGGYQHYGYVGGKLRARAVRRLTIK